MYMVGKVGPSGQSWGTFIRNHAPHIAAMDLLAKQEFELESVVPEGTMVKLALTGNMSTGGISGDRPLAAHPAHV